MGIHYNAFISYRHHPDDIKVASEIHRSLERFHVPRSIRKKYGKINQLFRDKEELPITSDLNDDIDAALKNSDYLIVICSVHLKESIWCQREIERFLQTHPKSKVLTVLASGEPYDVIPEILLYDDVVDPVTGQTQRIPIEPLSCDWRSKRRKIRQEELPRLAAPLLGCSYNELRQRQKQYRARRNAAIISSALIASFSLTAYFLYTSITIQKKNVQIQAQNEEIHAQNEEIKAANIQIQANLDESLINQSRHLATAAQERLAEGDRLTAISLAMAALPGENNVRPYVPEAEDVLISALGIYNTAEQLAAVGTVSPGMNIGIKNFWVTESEQYIYIGDQRDIITVWDAKTLQKCGEISLGDSYLEKLITLPNENAVIMAGEYGDTLFCYQPDGTLLWSLEDCSDVAYRPSAHVLLVIHQVGLNTNELLLRDADTGETLGQSVDLALEGSALPPASFLSQTLPEGLPVVVRYLDFSQAALYIVDPSTGQKQLLPAESAYPARTLSTQDGKVIFLASTNGTSGGVMEGNRVTASDVRNISCYDVFTGTLLWENTISTSNYSGAFTLEEIPGSNNVLCQSGNVFMILDKETGATVAKCEAGSGILDVFVDAQYAYAVLQDGYDCLYLYDYNSCYETKCMKNGVDQAVAGEGCYALHWYGDHITVYQNVMGTPAWETAFEKGFSVTNQKTCGQYLAFQDYSYLYLFDTDSKALIWQTERGRNELLGFSSDGKKLYYAEGKDAVIALDIATSKTESRKISLEETTSGAEIRGKLFFTQDCLYYTVGGMEVPKVVAWNLNTQEKKSCPLQPETEESIAYWSWEVLAVQGQYLWILGQDKMLLELNMTSGEVLCLAEEATQRPAVAIHSSGKKVAITDQGKVYLKTPGQAEITTVVPENANAGSVCFDEDVLLVLCDNGFIYRFDGSGTCLSQIKLNVGSAFSNDLLSRYADQSKISWYFTKDNKLIVNALGEGNIIDCENWAVRGSISGFLMYSQKSNSLVCKQGQTIAGYAVYETEQLLQLGEEELGGFCLTREQKVSYGID